MMDIMAQSANYMPISMPSHAGDLSCLTVSETSLNEGLTGSSSLVDDGTTAKVKAQHVDPLLNRVGLELQGVRLGWPQRSSTLSAVKDYPDAVRGRAT